MICIKEVLRVKHGQQLHKFNYRHISLKTWSVSGNAVSRVTGAMLWTALSVQIREIILKALPRLSGVLCSFLGSTYCVNSAMQSQWNDLSRIKDFLHHSWFWSPCIATPASILCKVWTREWKQTRASAHSAIVTYLCVSVWAEGGREAKSTFFSIAQLVASIVHFNQTQLWIQYNQCPINPYPLYLPKVLIFGSCYKGLWGWSVEELKANIFIAVFGLKTQQHQLPKKKIW